MSRLEAWLYPKLLVFSASERGNALRRARETPFDAVELIGMAAGLIVVTALTRYGADAMSAPGRILAAILNFAIALPLLAALIAPFMVRRVRRGLDQLLEERRDP